MFKHDFWPVTEITDETTEHGRYYITPQGNRYPSVTTVIGRSKGTQWLAEWHKKVGADKAKRIGKRATLRGTVLHGMAERYLRNQDWETDEMPTDLMSFETIRPILDRNLGTIFGIEYPLWSDTLLTAGRTDLIAEWNREPAVIDFKTSARPKKEEHVRGYLIQKATYARMIQERVGLNINRVVTVMMVDHDDPMILDRQRNQYDEDVDRIFLNRAPDAGLRICRPQNENQTI